MLSVNLACNEFIGFNSLQQQLLLKMLSLRRFLRGTEIRTDLLLKRVFPLVLIKALYHSELYRLNASCIQEAFNLWRSHVATRTPIFIIIKVEEFILRFIDEHHNSWTVACTAAFKSYTASDMKTSLAYSFVSDGTWRSLKCWCEIAVTTYTLDVELNSSKCGKRRSMLQVMTVSASRPTWEWINEGPLTVLYSTPSTAWRCLL